MRPQRSIFALSTISPLTLVLALGGCTKHEEEKPADEAVGAKAAEVPADVAEKLAKTAVPGAVRLEHDAEEVLGHFALPNASKLLADVRQQLVTDQYQNFLDEAGLRSLVSLALDKRGKVAQNIELVQPMGCAVVDFKTWENPVSCTFGYKGGVKALLSDLGGLGRKADSGDHVAVYEIEGEQVFIDSIGNHVVVAAHDDLFKKTQSYLKSDIIDRGNAMIGDLEVVAYTGTIWARYQKDIEGLMAQFQDLSASSPSETGNAKLDTAVKKWVEYNQKSTQKSLDRLSQFDQVALYVNVAEAGVSFGFTAIPTAGSQAEKEAKLAGGRLIDPAFVKTLPVNSWLVAAFNVNPEVTDTEQVREIRELAIDTWCELAGLDKASVTASVNAHIKESRGLFDGQGAFAFFDQEGATFGLAAVQHLMPGVNARELWKTWNAKFTPVAVLGKEFSQYITWEFTTDTAEIDGAPIDRWVIKPAAKLQAVIDKKIAEEPDAKQMIDQYWGPIALTIDRAETNGNVVWVISPKAEEAAMRRVLAAQKGDGSLASDPGLEAIFAQNQALSGLVAFDLKSTLGWLSGFPEIADKVAEVKAKLGNNLSDVQLTTLTLPNGVMTFEYVVTQPLIEQIKGMIAAQG